ncbi:ATP-binding protein [Saccharothrix australiensis]|uniref:Regulatory LuxR family protein n=1 Tax=Saccharothrix australiensis TaxID=2072 RepID=A0A495W3G1_9PSEU|nr:LuxR family transcriptional regulator [Saccharothrix australiensis]RKT55630.1 regulatory LuxR family protein [Saccharothrix australiensis]
MLLVERADELDLLRRRFADCRRGRGRLVVVSGPVASGKTELLHTFAEHVAGTGARVLAAACAEDERGLPLAVVDQLLRQASPRGDGPAGPATRHASAAGDTAAEAVVVSQLGAALLDLAAGEPVLITVDDVHHADGPSLQCLLHVVRRLTAARIMLVLSESAYPRTWHPLLHAELLRHPHCGRVRLAPLSPSGVAELLGRRRGGPTASRLHGATGGNPLLVRALLDDHEDRAVPAQRGGGVVPGEAFDLAVASVVHRLPPELLAVARACAVLGEPVEAEVVAALAAVDPAAVPAALHQLDRTGLLDGGRFRLPAARDGVLGGIAPSALSRLHALAARLRHRHSAPVAVVTGHLLAAALPPEPWAVDVLEDAASAAVAGGDTALAVRCLELARAGCRDPRRNVELRMALASVLWDVNPIAAADHLDALTEAARSGALARRHTGRLVRLLLWNGRAAEAAEVLGTERPPGAGDLSVTRAWLRCTYPALAAEPAAEPTGHPRAAHAVTGERVEAISALSAVLSGMSDEGVVARAEQVLRSTRLICVGLEPVVWSLLVLVYGDRVHRAEPFIAEYARQAEERGTPAARGKLSAVRALIALRTGDLAAAEGAALAALEHLPSTGWGIGVGLPQSLLVRATTARGRYDEAARLLGQQMPEAMFDSRYAVQYIHARGHFYLATGALEAARRDFVWCGELMGDWGIDAPALVPWRSDLAETELRLGDPDRAADLAHAQLGIAGDRLPRARGLALRQAAATAEPAVRLAHLHEAVELLQAVGDRYELARALGDLSHALHALGESNRARLVARRAWRTALECGAEPLLEALGPTAGVGAAGGDTADPRALSEAERRVGGLATLGYSNRDIARKLYITVSTVEQHLTRVYRKLGVHRRSELPASLQLAGADPA